MMTKPRSKYTAPLLGIEYLTETDMKIYALKWINFEKECFEYLINPNVSKFEDYDPLHKRVMIEIMEKRIDFTSNSISRAEHLNIHEWLRKKYGRANKCIFCSVEGKRYEWALLKGKRYEKNIENYIMLCPSCHRKYDYTAEMRIQRSWAALKVNEQRLLLPEVKKMKEVHKFDKNDNLIEIFETPSLAAKSIEVSISSICNCLNGRTKTCKGFKWKYKKDIENE